MDLVVWVLSRVDISETRTDAKLAIASVLESELD